ncbi:hypothetical protein DSO57_1031701 [Entomophthora muscae]|uniref:Uncharacterized protein n=1 Tax=Entomophthora muscae TaxID=34485 RepID=A0ACC2RFA1_9FUNG|nr:hypothetical protein DSO57_1031701 [Entomophthora muscae]
MSGLLDELLQIFYSVPMKLSRTFGTRETLLWDCLLLGIAFPPYMGIGRSQFWKYPEMVPIFKVALFLNRFELSYMAASKVILQMSQYLEVQIKAHCKFPE